MADHTDHSGHDHGDHSGHDHSAHDHAAHADSGHEGHNHSAHEGQEGHNHAGHSHGEGVDLGEVIHHFLETLSQGEQPHIHISGTHDHGGGSEPKAPKLAATPILKLLQATADQFAPGNERLRSGLDSYGEQLALAIQEMVGPRLVDAATDSVPVQTLGNLAFNAPMLEQTWNEFLAESDLQGHFKNMNLPDALMRGVMLMQGVRSVVDNDRPSGDVFAQLFLLFNLAKALDSNFSEKSVQAITDTLKSLPLEAEKVERAGTSGTTTWITDVKPGDLITVRCPAGSNPVMVPLDGELIAQSGDARFSDVQATGNHQSRHYAEGKQLEQGFLLTSGEATLRVTHDFEHSTKIENIKRIAEAAPPRSKTDVQEDINSYVVREYAPLTALSFLLAGYRQIREAQGKDAPFRLKDVDWNKALDHGSDTSISGAPCTIQSVPLFQTFFKNKLLEDNIIVDNMRTLELAEKTQTLFVDINGVITDGRQEVDSSKSQYSPNMLTAAALVERQLGSQHPIAQAIVEATGTHPEGWDALQGRISATATETNDREHGVGVQGTVDGKTVRAGNLDFLQKAGVHVPDRMQQDARQLQSEGYSVTFLQHGKEVGYVTSRDRIRDLPAARSLVEKMQKSGVDIRLLTGESVERAGWIARQIGVPDDTTHIHANTRRDEKAQFIAAEKQLGKYVAFMGDQANDGPAMLRLAEQRDIHDAHGHVTGKEKEGIGMVVNVTKLDASGKAQGSAHGETTAAAGLQVPGFVEGCKAMGISNEMNLCTQAALAVSKVWTRILMYSSMILPKNLILSSWLHELPTTLITAWSERRSSHLQDQMKDESQLRFGSEVMDTQPTVKVAGVSLPDVSRVLDHCKRAVDGVLPEVPMLSKIGAKVKETANALVATPNSLLDVGELAVEAADRLSHHH